MYLYRYCISFSLLFTFNALKAQVQEGAIARYWFNEIEKNGSDNVYKSYHCLKVEDRFGNSNSAIYLQGNFGSYINLGDIDNLKPSIGSISLWFKLEHEMQNGKGVKINPIFFTRSHSGVDYCEAIFIGYDLDAKRINCNTSLSEEKQVTLYSKSKIIPGKWYHLVFIFDTHQILLFLNGKLECESPRDFTNEYLKNDSLVIGNWVSERNKRFYNGMIDDIMIFDRPLKSSEVLELYKAPNPNKHAFLFRIISWIFILSIIILIIVLIIRARFKTLIKREKERNQIINDLMEQKIKVLRAQMNPHFIFNSLNTIQQFIITNNNGLAELYLSKFSKLLRSTLEINNREFVTLSEEIEYIKRYVEIESLRFGSRIELTVKIDSRIKEGEVRIPQMMIQPFVENSIWHGLPQRSGFKRINLFFDFISDKKVGCIVDDNGTGIKLEKNEALKKKKSFAIELIQQRLSLLGKLNKENYAFSVLSKFDEIGNSEGVRIEIEIPIIKSDT